MARITASHRTTYAKGLIGTRWLGETDKGTNKPEEKMEKKNVEKKKKRRKEEIIKPTWKHNKLINQLARYSNIDSQPQTHKSSRRGRNK